MEQDYCHGLTMKLFKEHLTKSFLLFHSHLEQVFRQDTGFLLTPPGQPTFLSASSKLHVATQATCGRCVHPRVEIVSQPFPEQEYCLSGSHGLLSAKVRAQPTGGAPKTLAE